MIWCVAAAAVFAALFIAVAYEPRTRPARPAFHPKAAAAGPLCPCGRCGRPAGQHVEPHAALLPSPVIRIPGQHRRLP